MRILITAVLPVALPYVVALYGLVRWTREGPSGRLRRVWRPPGAVVRIAAGGYAGFCLMVGSWYLAAHGRLPDDFLTRVVGTGAAVAAVGALVLVGDSVLRQPADHRAGDAPRRTTS